MGGVAVLPTGGLFGKKKDKELKDANAPEQNGTDVDLNSSVESDKDKKEKSKVSYLLT